MKSLTITLEDKLYNGISVIAETLFNNNKNNTISTILEMALELDELKLKINNRDISVKQVVQSYKDINHVYGHLTLTNVIKPVKAEFRKNFYLLDLELQNALLELFNDLKTRYECKFGTSANISTYYGEQSNLCFYINISGHRGQEPVEKYLKFLDNGKYKYKPYEGKKILHPRNTIWISRKDQFTRTLKYNPIISEQFYNKALQILQIDTNFDAVELSATDLLKLVEKI